MNPNEQLILTWAFWPYICPIDEAVTTIYGKITECDADVATQNSLFDAIDLLFPIEVTGDVVHRISAPRVSWIDAPGGMLLVAGTDAPLGEGTLAEFLALQTLVEFGILDGPMEEA